MMKPTHRIEHVCGVPYSGLHAFYHVFVASIGMARLKHNAQLIAEQRQLAHSLELRRYGHADNMTFRSIPKALH